MGSEPTSAGRPGARHIPRVGEGKAGGRKAYPKAPKATPEQAAPAQPSPEQFTPTQATPAQAVPEQAAPTQAAPSQAAPAQGAPAGPAGADGAAGPGASPAGRGAAQERGAGAKGARHIPQVGPDEAAKAGRGGGIGAGDAHGRQREAAGEPGGRGTSGERPQAGRAGGAAAGEGAASREGGSEEGPQGGAGESSARPQQPQAAGPGATRSKGAGETTPQEAEPGEAAGGEGSGGPRAFSREQAGEQAGQPLPSPLGKASPKGKAEGAMAQARSLGEQAKRKAATKAATTTAKGAGLVIARDKAVRAGGQALDAAGQAAADAISDSLPAKALGAASRLWEGAKGAVGGAIEGVKGAASAAWGGLSGAASAAGGAISGAGAAIGGALGVSAAAGTAAVVAAGGVTGALAVGAIAMTLGSLNPALYDEPVDCRVQVGRVEQAVAAETGEAADEGAAEEAVARALFSTFRTLGWSDVHVAGMLGNFSCECGMDPTTVEGFYRERYVWGPEHQSRFGSYDLLDSYTRSMLTNTYGITDLSASSAYSPAIGTTLSVATYGPISEAGGRYLAGMGLGQWTGAGAWRLLTCAESAGANWWEATFQAAYMVAFGGPASKGPRGTGFNEEYAQESFASASAAALFWARWWEGNTTLAQAQRQQRAEQWLVRVSSWEPDASLAEAVIATARSLGSEASVAAVADAKRASECDECETEEGTDSAPREGSVVGTAQAFLAGSSRYVLGGPAGKRGTDEQTYDDDTDCSGLVWCCYNYAGLRLAGTSSDAMCAEADANLVEVSFEAAVPGDICWWPSHVGVYIGGGRTIEHHGNRAGDPPGYGTVPRADSSGVACRYFHWRGATSAQLGSAADGGSASPKSAMECSENAIIRECRKLSGTPWRDGGTDESGLCDAGFVSLVYARAGVGSVPTEDSAYWSGDAPSEALAGWSEVSQGSAVAGDLALFCGSGTCGHVAIFAGSASAWHSSVARGVCRQTLAAIGAQAGLTVRFFHSDAVTRAASGGTSDAGGVAASLAGATDAQRKVVLAAKVTPSTGQGYCAAWVTNVFQNAGVGTVPYGNACDMYDRYCLSTNRADLKVGSIIAVRNHSHTSAGRVWGHVGIYVGDGQVMENTVGVRTTPLDQWVDYYNAGAINCTVKWGSIV